MGKEADVMKSEIEIKQKVLRQADSCRNVVAVAVIQILTVVNAIKCSQWIIDSI